MRFLAFILALGGAGVFVCFRPFPFLSFSQVQFLAVLHIPFASVPSLSLSFAVRGPVTEQQMTNREMCFVSLHHSILRSVTQGYLLSPVTNQKQKAPCPWPSRQGTLLRNLKKTRILTVFRANRDGFQGRQACLGTDSGPFEPPWGSKWGSKPVGLRLARSCCACSCNIHTHKQAAPHKLTSISYVHTYKRAFPHRSRSGEGDGNYVGARTVGLFTGISHLRGTGLVLLPQSTKKTPPTPQQASQVCIHACHLPLASWCNLMA